MASLPKNVGRISICTQHKYMHIKSLVAIFTNNQNMKTVIMLFVTSYDVAHRVPLPPATVSVQSPGDLASGSQHARALEFCTHLPLYVCRNPVASFSGLLASHHPDLTRQSKIRL